MNTIATTAKSQQAQQAMLAWAYDAGHAWLVVSLDDEDGFPEAEKFASQFSYINLMGSNFAGDVWLEEDVDAPAFLKTYGLDASHLEQHELEDGFPVRSWPTGKADADELVAILRK